MKKGRKISFFIVAILIFVFTYLTFFGVSDYFGDNKITYVKSVSDIRWGIDIQGGVEAVFMPEGDRDSITAKDMDKAEQIIKIRLTNNNITDAEVYKDQANKQVIVRFPWQSGTSDFDPSEAVKELGAMAMLTFREGTSKDGAEVLKGSADVSSAEALYNSEDNQWVVQLNLTSSGKTKFADATTRLYPSRGVISIWMDDNMISSASVSDGPILNGVASITGNFSYEQANALAEQINAGSLPFKLSVEESKLSIISPTLGKQSLDVMLMAGIIAFVLIVLGMILIYRLPGFVASIALLGQVAIILACISGFLPNINSFTLTIPGIAGIILSIGMGVDANVITAERIREEIRGGKTIDGAIHTGFSKAFSAILDGNVTVVIVSVMLMGAFGPPTSIWAKIVSPLMFLFNSSITGSIYSFGYTLLIGAIANLFIGVLLTRIMLKGLARFKGLQKPWLYGGAKNAK